MVQGSLFGALALLLWTNPVRSHCQWPPAWQQVLWYIWYERFHGHFGISIIFQFNRNIHRHSTKIRTQVAAAVWTMAITLGSPMKQLSKEVPLQATSKGEEFSVRFTDYIGTGLVPQHPGGLKTGPVFHSKLQGRMNCKLRICWTSRIRISIPEPTNIRKKSWPSQSLLILGGHTRHTSQCSEYFLCISIFSFENPSEAVE